MFLSGNSKIIEYSLIVISISKGEVLSRNWKSVAITGKVPCRHGQALLFGLPRGICFIILNFKLLAYVEIKYLLVWQKTHFFTSQIFEINFFLNVSFQFNFFVNEQSPNLFRFFKFCYYCFFMHCSSLSYFAFHLPQQFSPYYIILNSSINYKYN